MGRWSFILGLNVVLFHFKNHAMGCSYLLLQAHVINKYGYVHQFKMIFPPLLFAAVLQEITTKVVSRRTKPSHDASTKDSNKSPVREVNFEIILFQCFFKWKLLFYAQLIQIGVSQQWYICFINSSKLKNSFTILETQKKKASVTLKALQFGDTPFSRAYRAMMMNFKTPLAMQKLSLLAYHLL
jgi:hypothetical protein